MRRKKLENPLNGDRIIHTNDGINDAVKMQYLKTSITGDPKNAVNYKICRDILEKCYNIISHLQNFCLR